MDSRFSTLDREVVEMSELKEHLFCDCNEMFLENGSPLSNDIRHYYLKSEADNVIADLKQSEEMWIGSFEASRRVNARTESKLCYSNYKRCLAMAKWCRLKRLDASDYRIPREKWEFYDKWYKRWLELAEKFKHNNEVNNA